MRKKVLVAMMVGAAWGWVYAATPAGMPSGHAPICSTAQGDDGSGTQVCYALQTDMDPQSAPASAAVFHAPLQLSALESALLRVAPTLRQQALHAALSAFESLAAKGEAMRPILTVIDYSLPSTAKRLWTFNLANESLLFHELVAHGKNSGEDVASAFSNDDGSLMTSLGAFLTGGTYVGKNGYSLKLRGMDPGLNDHAEGRTIVLHGAPYVSEDFVHKVGRLGRSWGCPAVRPEIARPLIDQIKDSTLLYAWNPSLQPPEPAMATVTTATLD